MIVLRRILNKVHNTISSLLNIKLAIASFLRMRVFAGRRMRTLRCKWLSCATAQIVLPARFYNLKLLQQQID